ncbi:MAG TPA: hypothetical protein VGJ20_42960 [Xanthobacteraceae bacterium]|jgi:hypothetical protein
MMMVVGVMVMTVAIVKVLSEQHATVARFGAPRIVRLQSGRRVWNRIEKIPVTAIQAHSLATAQ